MSWNAKGAALVARTHLEREGFRYVLIENVGQAAARNARYLLCAGPDREPRPQWIRGELPSEIAPGVQVKLRLSTAMDQDGVLTLTWDDPLGDERRWHGPVMAIG